MKKIIAIVLLTLLIPGSANSLEQPVWYKRYKQLIHHSEHFIAKVRVNTLRYSIAYGRCGNNACLLDAYKTWLPTMGYAAKAFEYAFQAGNIFMTYCVNEDAMAWCVEMEKSNHEYGKFGGIERYAFMLIRKSQHLKDKALGEIQEAQPGIHKGGQDI